MLRLAGTPLRVLRGVVTVESAVRVVVVGVVSIAVGFAGAELFLRAQLGYTLRPPSARPDRARLIVPRGLPAPRRRNSAETTTRHTGRTRSGGKKLAGCV